MISFLHPVGKSTITANLALALLGLADNWIDFRARRAGTGGE